MLFGLCGIFLNTFPQMDKNIYQNPQRIQIFVLLFLFFFNKSHYQHPGKMKPNSLYELVLNHTVPQSLLDISIWVASFNH